MRYFVFFLFFHLVGFGQSLKANIDQWLEQKQFTKAEDTLQELMKKQPKNLEVIELLGDVYSNQKDWDKAIAQYEKLTELHGGEANYHYKYGGALSMKALSVSKLRAIGYLDDMEDAFLKAAELDSKHIEARWALARYYLHVPGLFGGDMEKAWQYTDELMSLSPVDGYLSKGHYYEDEEAFDKAESYYKQAILIGGSLTCYQHLIDLYLLSDQKNKALDTLKEAYEKLKKEELLEQIKELEKNEQ